MRRTEELDELPGSPVALDLLGDDPMVGLRQSRRVVLRSARRAKPLKITRDVIRSGCVAAAMTPIWAA